MGTYQRPAELDRLLSRRFLVAVEFVGLRCHLEEAMEKAVDYLTHERAAWWAGLMREQAVMRPFPSGNPGHWVLMVPMTAEQFLDWGVELAMIAEEACDPPEADAGNELLALHVPAEECWSYLLVYDPREDRVWDAAAPWNRNLDGLEPVVRELFADAAPRVAVH